MTTDAKPQNPGHLLGRGASTGGSAFPFRAGPPALLSRHLTEVAIAGGFVVGSALAVIAEWAGLLDWWTLHVVLPAYGVTP